MQRRRSAITLVGVLTAFVVVSNAWGQFKTIEPKVLSSVAPLRDKNARKLEFYLRLDGFAEEIPVVSFEQELNQTPAGSEGPTAGVVSLEPIAVTKLVDEVSPRLYTMCARHTETASGEVGARLPHSSYTLFQIALQNVRIVKAYTFVTQNGELMERIYLKPGVVYWVFKADGGRRTVSSTTVPTE